MTSYILQSQLPGNIFFKNEWELMYTRGGSAVMYGKTNTVIEN